MTLQVLHLFGPPRGDGGGVGVLMGRFASVDKAVEAGTIRLTRNADPSPHDRIQIRVRGRHPMWLYRDVDGRVCLWRRHPSQPLETWGCMG